VPETAPIAIIPDDRFELEGTRTFQPLTFQEATFETPAHRFPKIHRAIAFVRKCGRWLWNT
jgi:hypothetical protein